jgi:hypothetical protein
MLLIRDAQFPGAVEIVAISYIFLGILSLWTRIFCSGFDVLCLGFMHIYLLAL